MYLPNAFNVMYLPCNCSIVMYVHFQEFLLAMELHYYDAQTLTKNFTYHPIAVPIVIYRRYHHAIAIPIVWHFRFKRYYLPFMFTYMVQPSLLALLRWALPKYCFYLFFVVAPDRRLVQVSTKITFNYGRQVQLICCTFYRIIRPYGCCLQFVLMSLQ